MGKGARNRKRETAEVIPAKKSKKKLISIIVSAVAVSLVLTLAAVFVFMGGLLYRSSIAMESENFKVTVAMASYFFKDFCNDELAQNEEYYIYTMGYDPNTSLDEQYIDEENGVTLHKYLRDLSKDHIGEVLIYAEAARASGKELTDADYKKVDEQIDQLKSVADEYNYPFGVYLNQYYGKGVRESDVRAAIELLLLADKEYVRLENSFNPTEQELNDYYSKNREFIDKASYMYFTFNGSTAKARAEEMKKCKTAEEFKKYAVDFMVSSGKVTSKSKAEAEFEDYIKEDVYANSNNNISSWLFKEGRKAGDIHSLASNNEYTVYFVTKAPERDTQKSLNVRHILLSNDMYGNAAAAKAKAREILDEFVKSGKSAEKFSQLCSEFSEDMDTAESGGLYANYRKGDIEDAYEFEKWCFDTVRREGDAEIIVTDYGVHIMFLESFGKEAWELECTEIMKEEVFDTAHKDYYEKYPVTTDDSAFNNIK